MNKLFAILILTVFMIPNSFASAPDVRISGYKKIIASHDVMGVVASTPNGYLPMQLSKDVSRNCGMLKICTDAPNTKVYYGGPEVNAVTKKGVPLNPSTGASCDLVYVDNPQSIYARKDVQTVMPTISYGCYQ